MLSRFACNPVSTAVYDFSRNRRFNRSFSQSAELHDLLEKNGCDVTLVAINGAEHADIFFAQEKLWDMVAKFFKDKLYQ